MKERKSERKVCSYCLMLETFESEDHSRPGRMTSGVFQGWLREAVLKERRSLEDFHWHAHVTLSFSSSDFESRPRFLPISKLWASDQHNS
jgi:hypothetical protein